MLLIKNLPNKIYCARIKPNFKGGYNVEKEYLIKYKEKLANLSEEEKIAREKYLMDFYDNKFQGPLTGYPSIDKPQLGIYDEEKYFTPVKKETVCEALIRNNKDNLETVALDYFFTKIKYKELIERKDDLVKALSNYGVKKGDYVSVCMPGMPESMTSVYSMAHLGSVGIYLPPYLDEETMFKDITKKNSKIVLIMDMFYEQGKEKFDRVFEKAGIEHIIIVPTLNSSILGKITKKKKYDNPKIELYNDFIEKGKNTELPPMVEYEPDMPLAVVYSSGTTGVLKGVLLSHDTFNNSSASYKSFGFNLNKGQIVYQAIPLWSSTGLIADGTTALYYGCTLYQNPKFIPKEYSKNLGLHRINWGVATTELFNGLDELDKSKLFHFLVKMGVYKYKQLENIYIGGTFSSSKDKKKLEQILRSLGCNSSVNGSYGTCENGSIVTAELNNREYPDYSVGTPIPGVTVVSIDENNNELQYGQRGEIAVKTNCGMLKYFNRPDLDGIFFKEEGTNYTFKHTGDIGYVLPDGTLIYEGRKNDFSIINDEKIYNFDVKKVILSDEDVFDCEVFSKDDNTLYANIIFYDKTSVDISRKIVELQNKIKDTYGSENYVPEMFKIRDSFPMASSTKRDFKKIKEEKEGYINLRYKKIKKLSI